MSKSEVYHFSGSGNSFAVARDLARALDAELKPLAPLAHGEDVINNTADAVGLVFPIYDFKPPEIIRSFLRKMRNIESSYIFGVCTYGITPLGSLVHLREMVRSCGGELAAGFAVAMPHNAIGSVAVPIAENERMFRDWKSRVGEICECIRLRKRGRLESSSIADCILRSVFLRMLPSVLKFLLRIAVRGVNSLAFTADSNCRGCGTCQRVCPLRNIKMMESKPVWSSHCVSCFACFHWCPRQAISLGGADLNIRRYHHPDVSASDMIDLRRDG